VVLGTLRTSELFRYGQQRVGAQTTRSLDGLRDLRKLGIDDGPVTAEECVREAELVDASPLPTFPSVVEPVGRQGRVALQHGHLVSVFCQEHRCPEADDARAHDHHVRHDRSSSSRPADSNFDCRKYCVH
jgi:hypothetical protein